MECFDFYTKCASKDKLHLAFLSGDDEIGMIIAQRQEVLSTTENGRLRKMASKLRRG